MMAELERKQDFEALKCEVLPSYMVCVKLFFLLDCVCFFICFLAWLILGVVVTPDQCRGGGVVIGSVI